MFSLIFVAILSWKSRFSSWFCQFRSFFRRKAAFDFHIFHSPTVRILKIFLQIIRYMQDDIKKNVPWHILAPSAVACDIFLLRASAHPAERFLLYRKCDAVSCKVRNTGGFPPVFLHRGYVFVFQNPKENSRILFRWSQPFRPIHPENVFIKD